jgi:acyl-CoA thioesterase-1
LKKTLAWVADKKIDVVLVNPQYGDTLTKDQYYEEVVKAISEVARDSGVVLVDRFAAMRELQKEHADTTYLSTDNLHMNDVGHRCMAEQLARAIVGGLIEADADQVQSVF